MAYLAKITTLCYIRRNNCYLMLYRNRKEHDENEGKWIGIGGKLEEGESPDECMLREVYEETGLTVTEYVQKGIITFISDEWQDEYMVLYEATSFTGTLRKDCEEGELSWIDFDHLLELPLWEGDRIFLQKLIAGQDRISGKLTYHGDMLVKAEGFS